MVSARPSILLAGCAALIAASLPAWAQSTAPVLDERGEITVDGHAAPYRIRSLPVSSFPDLPPAIAATLTSRGCLIPQTYEARHPENVIHGSFERPGSMDWAVLCSANEQVTLLVFLASGNGATPFTLHTIPRLKCLQAHDSTGALGFDLGIDPASPARIHDAQTGMAHRPPAPDHDCVAEIEIDRKTIYHLYRNGAWESVPTE